MSRELNTYVQNHKSKTELHDLSRDLIEASIHRLCINDYAEFKETREELIRKKEELQVIFNLVPAMIWYKDNNNKILKCNELAAGTKGMRVEEMENRYTGELYPEEAEQYHRDDLEVIQSGVPKYGIIEPYQMGSGEKIWIKTDKIPYRNKDGVVSGVIVFATDITQLKQAEESLVFLNEASALLATSIDYHTILKQVVQLIVPRLADWCIIDLKESEMLHRVEVMHADKGKSRTAQVILKNPPLFDSHSPIIQVIRTKKSIVNLDVISRETLARNEEHLKAINEINPKAYIIVPLISRDQILGVLTLISAESGKRYTTQDLLLAENLARRAACAIDNAQLYRGAQRAIQMREDFFAIASHELITPITAHKLQLQMLRQILNEDIKNQNKYYLKLDRLLEMADYEVVRLTQLVSNLFDTARISSRHFALEKEKIDLASLIHRVVNRYISESPRRKNQISLQIDAPIVGFWDYVRLEQVVVNLLSNALKYGRDQPIKIIAKSENEKAILTVLDQGLGISKEFLSKVFDRYARATQERKSGSLGLGLYIVKQIVSAHGGLIQVESELNQGSSFRIELPL